ncbi:hypothetical protein CWI76_05205 [Pseudidiomarina marina]|uniref:Uncharacterized protein n=1 Tax=Pseudidiomarina marina TaxID=502366 RepID=A0A432YL10_9GAMM|nr:hypothetical protein CWI76_05205 [Pseudidiomarina marina]
MCYERSTKINKEVYLIDNFRSKALEAFFCENIVEGLPFTEPTLSEILEILIDLNSDKFHIEDFTKLWTVYQYHGVNNVVLTVNGVESCGAITFEYRGNIVIHVDYFSEG